jgi:hypothetical protein
MVPNRACRIGTSRFLTIFEVSRYTESRPHCKATTNFNNGALPKENNRGHDLGSAAAVAGQRKPNVLATLRVIPLGFLLDKMKVAPKGCAIFTTLVAEEQACRKLPCRSRDLVTMHSTEQAFCRCVLASLRRHRFDEA